MSSRRGSDAHAKDSKGSGRTGAKGKSKAPDSGSKAPNQKHKGRGQGRWAQAESGSSKADAQGAQEPRGERGKGRGRCARRPPLRSCAPGPPGRALLPARPWLWAPARSALDDPAFGLRPIALARPLCSGWAPSRPESGALLLPFAPVRPEPFESFACASEPRLEDILLQGVGFVDDRRPRPCRDHPRALEHGEKTAGRLAPRARQLCEVRPGVAVTWTSCSSAPSASSWARRDSERTTATRALDRRKDWRERRSFIRAVACRGRSPGVLEISGCSGHQAARCPVRSDAHDAVWARSPPRGGGAPLVLEQSRARRRCRRGRTSPG